MPGSVPNTPSAAALLYLFADRLVEPDSAMSQGFKVPCTEVSVKRTLVAAEIFAVSFWSLQEQEKIELSLGKRTLLGLGKPQITATLRPGVTGEAPPQAGPLGVAPSQVVQMGVAPPIESPERTASPPEPPSGYYSLEDHVTHILGQLGTAPVRDVIQIWFGSDTIDPQRSVLERIVRELVDLGVVSGFQPGGLLGLPQPVFECEKRATLEGTAVELLERWRAFRDAPGLGPTLVDRSKAAIGSMSESSS